MSQSYEEKHFEDLKKWHTEIVMGIIDPSNESQRIAFWWARDAELTPDQIRERDALQAVRIVEEAASLKSFRETHPDGTVPFTVCWRGSKCYHLTKAEFGPWCEAGKKAKGAK